MSLDSAQKKARHVPARMELEWGRERQQEWRKSGRKFLHQTILQFFRVRIDSQEGSGFQKSSNELVSVSSFFNTRSNKNTFRPLKKHVQNERRAALQQHQMETLGFGNMREAVQLPEGEDINEWFAVNIVDFFNQLSMLYATITEFCTPQTCPTMSAGPAYKYLWSDSNKYPKPVEVPACEYIGLLMDWVDAQLTDESIFPSMIGVPFPKNFEAIVKNIMKRLFRIYAHCYYHHLNNFKELGTSAHLNTSFKQFVFFTKEFNLIPQEQLDPLKEIIDGIMKST